MSLSFRVESLDDTMRFLERRGGTFLAEPIEDTDARGGRYRAVEIATPLGDVAFRFVERSDYRAFAPGLSPRARRADRFGEFLPPRHTPDAVNQVSPRTCGQPC